MNLEQTKKEGFLLVDKPVDWTSHDVVGYLRKITGIKKIGHAGTLDPFATGLLIVGVGRSATKQLDTFKELPKTYEARVDLGAVSDTQDSTGTITEQSDHLIPPLSDIQETISSFVGTQAQIPPMHSAKKINGKKLYTLARKGIEIERKPHSITIHSIKINRYEFPQLHVTVECSTGTYIRTLAYDIGNKLLTGAYCGELRRTHIGPHNVTNATPPKTLTQKNWKEKLLPNTKAEK